MAKDPGFKAPIGEPPRLEMVPIGRLWVDDAYQRDPTGPVSQGLIRQIATHWDWRLCQPLAVAERDGGTRWVVDGQHRLLAARLRGDIAELPCIITRHSDETSEAELFVALNKHRRKLNAADLHRAAFASGDPNAAEIEALMARAGLRFARHSNFTAWKPGELFCVPGVARALKTRGKEATSNALVALGEAYAGQVLRFGGSLLEGLVEIYARDAADDGFDPDAFIEMLGDIEQISWIEETADYRRRNPGMSRRDSLVAVFRRDFAVWKALR